MTPDLALQSALLLRMERTSDLTALVPVTNLIDGHGVPARFPSIIFGEGQVLREPMTLAARHRRIASTLHIWTKSMPAARAIAGEVTAAIEREPIVLGGGHHAVSTVVESVRFLRDPDGETAHVVLTVDCLCEVAS